MLVWYKENLIFFSKNWPENEKKIFANFHVMAVDEEIPVLPRLDLLKTHLENQQAVLYFN